MHQPVDQIDLMLLFRLVFHQRGGSLIGPPRNGSAEVARQDRMVHFVRNDRIENPFQRALDAHPPAKHVAVVEAEFCRAASSEILTGDHRDAASRRPSRQLAAEPQDSQIDATGLRRFSDEFRDRDSRSLNVKVLSLMRCTK